MIQVKDEPELLGLMMKDSESAPALYKTTNFWAVKERALVPEIKKLGLKDFRRRYKSYLTSFGAADPPMSLHTFQFYNSPFWNSNLLRKIPFWSRVLAGLNIAFNNIPPTFLPIHSEITISDIQRLSYEYTRLYGAQRGAKPLETISDSLVGNPADAFYIDGRPYTPGFLALYMRYAYLCQFINFDSVKVMVELGAGSGRQTEVLKKLYPDMCFIVLDIPPQIYVCEQFLKTVFPDSVVPYEKTRTFESLRPEKGKIFIMGNWKFPLVERLSIDLFWNSASFQEMEPDVVANYLTYVNKSAKNVYLRELMHGQVQAVREGQKGVLQKTVLKHYQEGLPRFEMVDLSPSTNPLGAVQGCSDSFWRLKNH